MKLTKQSLTTVLTVGGLAACLGAAMPRQSATSRVKTDSESTTNMVIQDDDRKVEVHIVNDDTTVKINGKEVPASRIKRENGRLIILDKDGKEIEDIVIGLAGPEGKRFGAVLHPQSGLQWNNLQDQAINLDNGNMTFFNQDTPKVFVGVSMAAPDAALRKHLRLGDGEGVMITAVYDDSPAKDAGLEQYDVIVKINGEEVLGAEGLRDDLKKFEPGDEVRMVVIQEGREHDIEVKLAPYDSDRLQAFDNEWFNGNGMQLPPGAFDFQFGNEGFTFTPDENIDRFFISPEDGGRFFVAPDINLRGWNFTTPDSGVIQLQPKNQQNADSGDTDINTRLERLHDRIGELEKMLQKLLDRDSGD